MKENLEEINFEYYQDFREKCLKINEIELYLNMNEFFYLAQTIDFVAKCFIESTLDKLEKMMISDMRDENFDLKKFKIWYWTQSTDLFQDFRAVIKDEKLLKCFDYELNYKNEKLLNALMKN